MLNQVKLHLQGKNKTVVDMISDVQAFKQKVKLVSSQLQKHAHIFSEIIMMSELKAKVNNVINSTGNK